MSHMIDRHGINMDGEQYRQNIKGPLMKLKTKKMRWRDLAIRLAHLMKTSMSEEDKINWARRFSTFAETKAGSNGRIPCEEYRAGTALLQNAALTLGGEESRRFMRIARCKEDVVVTEGTWWEYWQIETLIPSTLACIQCRENACYLKRFTSRNGSRQCKESELNRPSNVEETDAVQHEQVNEETNLETGENPIREDEKTSIGRQEANIGDAENKKVTEEEENTGKDGEDIVEEETKKEEEDTKKNRRNTQEEETKEVGREPQEDNTKEETMEQTIEHEEHAEEQVKEEPKIIRTKCFGAKKHKKKHKDMYKSCVTRNNVWTAWRETNRYTGLRFRSINVVFIPRDIL